MAKIGRNDPCPCGSGKKYKKCCMAKDEARAATLRVTTASGEEATFRQARYDLLNQSEAINRLNQAPDFDADEPKSDPNTEISYDWLETGESAELMKKIKGMKSVGNPLFPNIGGEGTLRLLGDIKIKDGKLLFNAMGEQRFELGKNRLESLLAGLVKHRLDSVQSLTSALADHEQSRPSLLEPSLASQALKFDPHDPKFRSLGPGETMQGALRSRNFENIEEANFFAQRAMQDYNNQPQTDMGGLSPMQVGRLFDCQWDDSKCPMVLNKNLTLQDLKDQSPLLGLSYFLIATCEKLGGIKATKAGYLNASYVLTMAAQIMLDEEDDQEAFLSKMKGRLKETDMYPLFLARSLCQYSSVIELQKGRFSLTDYGREMLDPQNAGRFYTQLFISHFQDLDLDALDSTGQTFPSIQHTLAFSLYVLSAMEPNKWYMPTAFYPRLLLPAAKREVGGSEEVADWSEDDWWRVIEALDSRLIDPLREFGLLQDQDLKTAKSEIDTFKLKTTPLLKKFVSFNL